MFLICLVAFSFFPILAEINGPRNTNLSLQKLLLIVRNLKRNVVQFTLESVIDVGQGISIGPGRFGKKNKRRALNKRRAWKVRKKE